jgi:hypothetical protein
MNQITHGGIAIFQLPCHLSGLLCNPDAIRMCSAAREMHSPCAVFDKEKRIQCLQREGFDGKEIAGQEMLFVMTRNVRQELPYRDRSGAGGTFCRCNTVRMVVALTSSPSLRSSPSSFSNPGLSRATCKIQPSSSLSIGGRPGFFPCLNVHLRRTRSRCHPITVSGLNNRTLSLNVVRALAALISTEWSTPLMALLASVESTVRAFVCAPRSAVAGAAA